MSWSWKKPRFNLRYSPLNTEPEHDELELSETNSDLEPPLKPRPRYRTILIIAITPIIFILAIVVGSWISTNSTSASTSTSNRCSKRQEWRSLTPTQQQTYISAVKCLQQTPSRLSLNVPNTTLYSDFPYIHAHIGYKTHHSARFLPWHRYFLQIYADALRESCSYSGPLVYWDWTLDAADIPASPVFDAETGFGGDGDPFGAITVGKTGRCVVDGPFAGTTALWYDVKYAPHCLSRGFRNDEGALGVVDGADIMPEAIDEVLRKDGYEEFVDTLEAKVHDAIPFGVAGDFETFSAPFDPLFYLHHVQLDRLWWIWQQEKPEERLMQYTGHANRHSIEMAQLTDMIDMGPLAPQIEVSKLMDTSGGDQFLCYSY